MRAVFLLALLAIYSLFFSLFILLGGIVLWIIPLKSWRRTMMRTLLMIPVFWTSLTNNLMQTCPGEWEIRGEAALNDQKSYLLIANHQTWLDILVLGFVFNRKIPVMKFFMKKELLWSLPLVGLGCWILGYPIMHRHSKQAIRKHPELRMKDVETAKKSCQKFMEFPTTVMNFVEGTRFRDEKRARQISPYNHLLKPKAGGIAIVMNEFRDRLSGILNVTIHYSEPNMTLLKFFRKGCRKITVHYELIPVTPDLIGNYYEDREFRKYIQQWLSALWEKKDLLLDNLNEKNR